jgi:hypothetical protein
MRKRVQIALAALLVAVLGLIALAPFSRPTPEPTYQGKTLRQWLVLLDSHTEHKAQNDAAATAIERMGKNALPGLVHILQQRPDPPLLAKVEGWAVRFHLRRPAEIQLDEWQYRAARSCCILGGWIDVDITSAIPALASHATNATSRGLEPFMWGLVYSGPKGLSIVTNLLAQAASAQVREEAARSLWITPKIRTPEIANALLSATRDVDGSVRVTAILSLQSFLRQKGLDRIILPGAILCLQDTNSAVRRYAIDLLAGYSSAPGVGAALSNLLSDPALEVRSRAQEVLEKSSSQTGQE